MSNFNAETLAELREDMEDDFGELVDTFIEDAKKLMMQIEDAYSSSSGKDLQYAAHALKSCSGYLGAEKVAGYCDTIETLGREDALTTAKDAITQLRPALDATLKELRMYCDDELVVG